MQLTQSLPWNEPLDIAASLMASGDDTHWTLLYSGIKTSYSGRFSYLAYKLKNKIQGSDFSVFKENGDNQERLDNAWFGYFGYGLKNGLEDLNTDTPNWLTLPNLCLMQFSIILIFDHEERSISVWSDHPNPEIPPATSSSLIYPIGVKHLTSNMTRSEYLDKVADITQRIHAGDLYQANLTRKFMGEFVEIPDTFRLFRVLCAASPAPYSAFLRLDNTYVLSSSPELFLHMDANGHIRTRPIKGTSARFADPALDLASRESLAKSVKDRAENLMIADLMRNDLSRSCLPGSIKTPALFEVTTHANVHHMSSTVTGQKRPDCSALDVIKHCFPPGSMTGAPKITAMNLCSQLERVERGIYSGALGWLGGDGSCELSVIIRTLIVREQKFEFQVGGGIVADSIPDKELKETIDKSIGILKSLGLSAADIESL